jgi:hypothetical protein
MNKSIQISGQTIELPFTEEKYQEYIEEAKGDWNTMVDDADSYFRNGLAIGLHLAEKVREDEVEQLRERVKYLEGGRPVCKLCEKPYDVEYSNTKGYCVECVPF